MSREDYIKQLEAIAKQAGEEKYDALASILYTLLGAMTTDNEKILVNYTIQYILDYFKEK